MLTIPRTPSHPRRRAYRPGLESLEGRALLSGTAALPIPAPATHLKLMAPTTATAGGLTSLTVTATDDSAATTATYQGTVHLTSSDAAAVLPADYTFTTDDAGSHVFSVRLMTAGPATVGVVDTARPALQASASVSLVPSTLDHFDVALPATVVAGASPSLTVTARDAAGNPILDYGGTVHFASTSAGTKLPADHTFTAADHGAFTTTLALATAGTQTIMVSAGAAHGMADVAVTPGPAVNLAVTVPPRTVIDQPLQVSVRALDAQGNLVTGYAGTAQLTSTDGSMTLPAAHAFAAADAGQWTTTVTPHMVGDFTLSVADGATTPLHGTGFVAVRYATANQNYVDAVYHQLLGRPADRPGLGYWGTLLNGGAPRAVVAGAIQGSLEFRTKTVTELYKALLNRAPDGGGLNYFVDQLGRGATSDGVEAMLIGSAEYLHGAGGTNPGFLNAAFVDILNRAPDDATLASFGARLTHGDPRGQIAQELIGSAEAEKMVVQEAFTSVLRRDADPGTLAAFGAAQQHGMSSAGVALAVLASDEFVHTSS